MIITRHQVKSCCGHKILLFISEKPIRKFQIDFFKKAGYRVPPNFYQHGIFYVSNKRLIATAPFGTNRINVKCYGDECPKLLLEFEQLLEKATNIKKINS